MSSNECHNDSDDSDDEESKNQHKTEQIDDFEQRMIEEESKELKELVFDYMRMKYTGHRNAR